ncbi:uncharacterized protein LOC126979905 isoform X1 [Leptidea sinapis]|uniref:Uncharacterized protein n=1 Tax=Leptidea sinapis TaxID=189913 RepID=A0A5E4QGG0_9NEOP|nr:uncharacterized protein LOC126979905 isoform X1 [Leptidea sinapis]VVC97304.1 unnamed protein product [Leptidea sinapis]
MNNHNIEQLHLLPRNEGKIKSYASCADVRAWSHDIRVRNAFLRDWMKTDMPICVIPVHMVSKLLRSMTWRSRGKVTPQCHPGCKSKVVLESICSSCHAVKECIRKEESLQKYYQEEEFETSHWPCEKCLEALKSIKLFWKIILEKVFGIVIPTEDDFKSIRCSSIRSLSKNWEDEIIEQTVFLRKLIPLRRKHDNYDMHTSFDKVRVKLYSKDILIVSPKSSEHSLICSYENKFTETDNDRDLLKGDSLKINKSVYGIVDKTDTGCDNCCTELNGKEKDKLYTNQVECLHEKLQAQSSAFQHLQKENETLKLEPRHTNRNGRNLNISSCCPLIKHNSLSDLPVPYEFTICDEYNNCIASNSEMIITLKNCTNENYKYISLLQVVHKTNDPRFNDNVNLDSSPRNLDPMELLKKVKRTVGEIVQRELSIVDENQKSAEEAVVVKASYHKNNL